MSSYVNFYLRVNDSFAPLGSYSRSSEMYQAMQARCPYEKIAALTSNDLLDIIHGFEDKINHMKEVRKADEKRCELIMQANNPLDEKLQAVDDIESNFADMDDFIEELQFAADTLRVFRNMIEEFKYTDSSNKFSNDFNHYIYAGIEATGDLESVFEEN